MNTNTDKFTEALQLLRNLADIQNGPPLVTVEKEWDEIMTNVYNFLEAHEKPTHAGRN